MVGMRSWPWEYKDLHKCSDKELIYKMKRQDQAAGFLEIKRVTHPVKVSKVERDEDDEKERTTGMLGNETKAAAEEAEARALAIGKTEVQAAVAVEYKAATEEEAKRY